MRHSVQRMIPFSNGKLITTTFQQFSAKQVKIQRHAAGIWTDENNRILSCELEFGGVQTSELAFLLA